MKNYTNVCFSLDISTTVTNSVCSGTGESSIFLFSTEKRLFISEASIRRDLSQTASLFRLLITVFGSSFRYKCFVLLYLNDSVFFRTKFFSFLSEITEEVIMAVFLLEIEA